MSGTRRPCRGAGECCRQGNSDLFTGCRATMLKCQMVRGVGGDVHSMADCSRRRYGVVFIGSTHSGGGKVGKREKVWRGGRGGCRRGTGQEQGVSGLVECGGGCLPRAYQDDGESWFLRGPVSRADCTYSCFNSNNPRDFVRLVFNRVNAVETARCRCASLRDPCPRERSVQRSVWLLRYVTLERDREGSVLRETRGARAVRDY